MPSRPELRDLASTIEQTLLSATATPAQIEGLCEGAVAHGFVAVCVNPFYVEQARKSLSGSDVSVVSVVAFPLGASSARVAACEAEAAAEAGAQELDLVAPLGLAAAGDFQGAARFIAEVRRAVPAVTLKVILETGYFEAAVIRALGEAALAAGADFLKTSTGFGPRGATEDDVRLLVQLSSGRARVKASGGIRTREQALTLLAAGAARIGTSSGIQIVTVQSSGR
jgi:deoxyribose-phosphate aldolase